LPPCVCGVCVCVCVWWGCLCVGGGVRGVQVAQPPRTPRPQVGALVLWDRYKCGTSGLAVSASKGYRRIIDLEAGLLGGIQLRWAGGTGGTGGPRRWARSCRWTGTGGDILLTTSAHTRAHTHADVHAPGRACDTHDAMHTRTRMRPRAHKQTHTHAPAHADARACAPTHTHHAHAHHHAHPHACMHAPQEAQAAGAGR
jgi:hypothetical protein